MLPSDSDEDFNLLEGPGGSHIPPTIYIIKFHRKARREAVEFLLERIEAKQKNGGAELFIRCQPQKEGQGVVVHVSATKIKLLEVAEATDLQKQTAGGLVQDFSVRELDQFLYAGQTLDTILTPAEREYCVRHELDSIRVKDEDHLPGYPHLKLYPGQSVLDVYRKERIIKAMFPLHDRQQLETLSATWYKSILHAAPLGFGLLPPMDLTALFQPLLGSGRLKKAGPQSYLEEIRAYFGEAVGMYFSFLGFYTLLLLAPALLGVAQVMLAVDTLSEYAFFAAFNLVWVTLFLELWKRRCAGLAYTWGTLERSQPIRVRPSYHGDMQHNPVTGRYEPHYPPWKTRTKVYLVSVPVVAVSIMAALWVMVMAFWAEEQLLDWKKRYGSVAGVFVHVPSAIYAAIVWLMNFYYKRLANFLTEWENHRTQNEHDWYKVSKLVAFEFVNNFSSLFYIAFYIQDMDLLCSQVATLLIVTQMINHFQEALLPFVVKKAYAQCSEKVLEILRVHPVTARYLARSPPPVHTDLLEDQTVPVLSLDPKDPRIQQAKEESELDPYKDVYEDYLEMFLQFGYVFLFSSVYPMAAFWAVLNNVLELKTDAFKLCRVYQRPAVHKVANIGVWQSAFELLGAIAVMTNCALLCLSPRLRPLASGATAVEWVLLFVVLEHVILALKMILMWVVPDQPFWVREALDKISYQSKLALRNERGKRTRRHLSRRFRSVHGVPRSGSRSRGTTPVNQNGGLRRRSPSREFMNYKEH